jgi:hypothetical protein
MNFSPCNQRGKLKKNKNSTITHITFRENRKRG